MISKTKDIAIIGVYTALLIGVQCALGWAVGVELVTVMLAAFCYNFGLRRSVALVNSFILLRCFIWGMFPTVMILYVVYYNVFAVVFSALGMVCARLPGVRECVYATIAACVMTALFTLLDDIITPLYYGFDGGTAQAYFYASLYAMAVQTACAAGTVTALFRPLIKTFYAVGMGKRSSAAVAAQ